MKNWALLCFSIPAGFLWAAPAVFLYTEAPRYDPAAAGRGGERFPAGAVLRIDSSGRRRLLAPGFAAAADAAVSFDGRRVLFAGRKRAADNWQVWETSVEGGIPRRVVSLPMDCITPFYLPPDRLVFACRTTAGFALRTASLAGGAATPLTFAPIHATVSDVLRDGRVLFEAAHGTGIRDLFTVYSDGSGVRTYRCDHRADRQAGREVSSGDVIFTTAGRLARFTSALAVETAVTRTAGEFAGPVAELDNGDWLVSYRADARGRFALYRWKPGSEPPRVLVAADACQPVVVRPRVRPRIHPSALGDREGANLLCLSAYVSKLPLPRGSVARVRVWTQDGARGEAALGAAPVESDGSFYVHLPADRPLRIELLDRAGATVARERGWFWLRKGEQRVCVGCHAGPERAPDNAVPRALEDPTPVKLTGSTR